MNTSTAGDGVGAGVSGTAGSVASVAILGGSGPVRAFFDALSAGSRPQLWAFELPRSEDEQAAALDAAAGVGELAQQGASGGRDAALGRFLVEIRESQFDIMECETI